jgi:hypothetical protein
MANIFNTEHDESPLTVIRQTMSVSLTDEGAPVVSFATNKGKGSGAQTMPIDQFADYVSVLEGYVADGIPEGTPEENLTAAESVQRTIKSSDGVISFRVRSGKGSKPAKLPAADFAETVKLLRSTVAAVVQAGESLTGDSE